MLGMTFSLLNGIIANVVVNDLDLNFQYQTFQVFIYINRTFAIRYDVRYLPSNGATANVVSHDQHSQGKIFRNLIISKMLRGSEIAQV